MYYDVFIYILRKDNRYDPISIANVQYNIDIFINELKLELPGLYNLPS